jgi:hypothetical protein
VIELDFVADESPELWNLTGAAAREAQSLHDLYPGRLRFTVNGTDLSPRALVPLLATAAPMNELLAAAPPTGAASWAVSDQLPGHAYTLQWVADGRIRVGARWSDAGATCVEAALRAAWGCFTERVLGELAARDRSVPDNVVVRGMMPAVLANQASRSNSDCRLFALDGVETRGDRRALEAAADAVARVAWSYGGFTEIGANPITVRVAAGATVTHPSWSGEMDAAGHPVIRCVIADGVDEVAAAQVVREAALSVLRPWGVPEDSPVLLGLRVARFTEARS